ncbi:hypothetical protein ES708_11290 [subsurface metagenome]
MAKPQRITPDILGQRSFLRTMLVIESARPIKANGMLNKLRKPRKGIKATAIPIRLRIPITRPAILIVLKKEMF